MNFVEMNLFERVMDLIRKTLDFIGMIGNT